MIWLIFSTNEWKRPTNGVVLQEEDNSVLISPYGKCQYFQEAYF